jgi:preprotein translocase subunit SecD
MKSIRSLLQEADPLTYEATCPPVERERQRQAIVEAVSAAAQFPSHARSRWRSISFVAVAAIVILTSILGSRTHSPFVSDLQAAVRFEVKLAESKPGPGLREVKRAGSEPPVYIHQEAVVTNSDIASAQVVPGAIPGRYAVQVEFNTSGAAKMRAATAGHIGRPVAILIDGEAVMAPVLRTPISASAVVTGNFTKAEAGRIVNGVMLR